MKKIFSILSLVVILQSNAQTKIYCDDVEKAKEPFPQVTYEECIETRIGSKFEACDLKLRNQMYVKTSLHPFVSTLFTAYNDHRPISISPDMIWLLICQGFANHINLNQESLKTKFVSFDDQKKLTIETTVFSHDFKKGSKNSPWELAFHAFSDSIAKYTKTDIHNLFVQSFSTTTSTEKAAFEIALLDAMSGYFEYEVSTACGFPEINIEGTKEDWQKIKANLNGFKGYGIDEWINALHPIILQFIDANDKKIDKSFWSNIFKRKDESGGPYITGWIIKFFPYINDGNQTMVKNPFITSEPEKFREGLQTNQFNNGLSKVSFVWKYMGKDYEMEFLAGFIGIKQDKKTLTLRPEIGWVVRESQITIKPKLKEQEKEIIPTTIKQSPKKNSNFLQFGLLGILLFIAFTFFLIKKLKR